MSLVLSVLLKRRTQARVQTEGTVCLLSYFVLVTHSVVFVRHLKVWATIAL